MAKRSVGATNKRKGSNAEREYAKFFRELGFTHCITARQGSRYHDDAGIDLINLPFNVQIKAGKHKGMNVSKVLYEIKETITLKFPKDAAEHNNPLILIHRKEMEQGKRTRNDYDEIVSMSIQDFKKLINKIKWE
jgi:Holliday junction resolvase